MQNVLAVAAGLSDSDLLARVAQLASREREATVELVAHLAEVESRKLHLAEGYGSLFAYCTGALRLAEHAAYNRIEAARLARRFPAVLDLLAEGVLNLSTARRLAPHLRPDNFEAVVARARGRSTREVEVLVAGLAPQPDVSASVRRLPAPSRPVRRQDRRPGVPSTAATVAVPAAWVAGPTVASVAVSVPPARPAAVRITASEPPMPRGEVRPLAPGRYRVQFTIDAATHEKLGRVQDLLRREIPNGDPGAIFGRALDLLLEDVARRKLAVVEKARPGSPTGRSGCGRGSHRGRHIPAFVKRAVWVRDGGRCAFVAAKGRRCTERAYLEFHHREPYALGGEATVANISLRCRAHNAYEAELDFGGRGSNSSRDELMPVVHLPVVHETEPTLALGP